jgi:endonuclease/exonuclease/phosphatase (EEP) superfamily protein YafD
MGLLRVVVEGVFTGVVFALAFGCAAAALLAQGGRFNDHLDVLAHFAPFWFAGAAAATVIGLIMYPGPARAMIVVFGLTGAIAAGLLIIPEYTRPMSDKAPADAPHRIKLIQYNVWGRNQGVEKDFDWLVAQEPDIIVVEEPSRTLRRLLEDKGFHVTCPRCAVMIFSRAKPIDDGIVSPEDGPRAPMARAVFQAPGGPYTVLAVHYTWPTDGWMQQAQGQRLARVLDGLPKPRAVLLGDFNSTPWSFSRRREDARFGLERRTRALFSWPAGRFTRHRFEAPFPFLPIDHVYAGADWRTVSIERGSLLSSDHYPVVAVLALDGDD